jgi:TatD DNase family protein
MKYIDTHSHLNLKAFADDVEEVVKKCVEREVGVINIGTKLSTSKRAVELANIYENMWAMVGLHPIQTTAGYHGEDEIGQGGDPFASKGETFETEAFRELATHDKVVGIGECGFDYYHTDVDSYESQEREFIAQIELANELGLPLMIHTRNAKSLEQSPTGRSAYADVYEVLLIFC